MHRNKTDKSHLYTGGCYRESGNFFNALQMFKIAVEQENAPAVGLAAMANIYNLIGLQKKSLKLYNKSVYLFFNKRVESAKLVYFDQLFSGRADLNRILGNEEAMMKDIETAQRIELSRKLGSDVLLKYFLKKGDFTSALDVANEATRGDIYCYLRQYEQALKSYELSINESISQRLSSHFGIKKDFYVHLRELAKSYTDTKKQEFALAYCDTYDKIRNKMLSPGHSHGLIQSLNYDKGYGFILSDSLFNNYDTLFFRLGSKDTFKVGDRVSFDYKYILFKNELQKTLYNVSHCMKIPNITSNLGEIYHGIIHNGSNGFKTTPNSSFIKVFYPQEILLPFSLIDSHLTGILKEDLVKNGYVFIELIFSISQDIINSVISVKPISLINVYATRKAITTNFSKIPYKEKREERVAPGEEAFWRAHYSGDYSDFGGF